MNRFKALRLDKELTQVELANLMGVKQTTVSKWEVDKAIPDYPTLIKLAEFYGVTADYLLDIENSGITYEEYKQGARYKMPVNITADEEDCVDVFREIGEIYGHAYQRIFIEIGEVFFLNKPIDETEHLKNLMAKRKNKK